MFAWIVYFFIIVMSVALTLELRIFSRLPIRDKTRPMFFIHDIFDPLSWVLDLELEP